ncbi:MAG: M48 family metalloprotease, partial [Coriobacteriia bacterium]|nr:M48 family metalloprotease [Coriobacteriia bacterium]
MARYEVREHRREPLWDRVDRNRVRLAVFLVLFFAVSTVSMAFFAAIALFVLVMFMVVRMGEDLSGVQFVHICVGLVVAAAASSLAYMVWALTRDERWFAKRLEAPLVPQGELLQTKYALKDMAIASGFEIAPAMHVIETPNVNAFVFGWGNRRPIVGVTRGLTERLTADEQRAVFANLMTRLRAGDTLWASAVTALMAPLWRFSTRRMRAEEGILTREATMPLHHGRQVTTTTVNVPSEVVGFYALVMLFIIISELLLFGHRASQLRHAEVADGEGMLLLKDPGSMLSALEKSVRFNNFVPTAGPGMAQLFYCWTGEDSTDDEDDPENRRVDHHRPIRLRRGQLHAFHAKDLPQPCDPAILGIVLVIGAVLPGPAVEE